MALPSVDENDKNAWKQEQWSASWSSCPWSSSWVHPGDANEDELKDSWNGVAWQQPN